MVLEEQYLHLRTLLVTNTVNEQKLKDLIQKQNPCADVTAISELSAVQQFLQS